MKLRLLLLTLLCLLAAPFALAGVDQISDKEAGNGLREALNKAATIAVNQLGTTDGFFGDSRVKIPLPESLKKGEVLVRTMGYGKQADELVLTMNRAAESAVTQAKPILVDSIKKMSWQDAKEIVTGGDTAATEYFRRTTSQAITAKFRPVVSKATARVQLADKYNAYAGMAAQLGLIKAEDANLDDYVTQKALDGLFLMIAEQEKAIRKDPLGQASKLLQKVFGQ
ncbi:DUF4197 domain-containing protein [Andreprevotia chitinilytica]|uniref:DUF4197 domain-containing protein n=1 Tax=Andreprevotia chitinilytica TaxID=396808 RepID=UPI00054FFED9|nr:DUF4197 domain-containing protein [Andreprevotia chitinilytica]